MQTISRPDTSDGTTSRRAAPPRATPAPPEDPLGYRMKTALLGQPLNTERLEHETLGKPTALAVFASDNLSSCAYATEEILRVLVPYVGLAAFTLVTPVTVALLVVLGFLILSYRQTIKAYPSAGGAYIVTRDNFGLLPAQVAGVALLTDYVLTVAVSVAAGTDAMASAISGISPYKLWISIGWVVLIAWGNLRGTKESGKLFAAPTYFFIANMGALLTVGMYKLATGGLTKGAIDVKGMVPIGSHAGNGFLMGATVFIVLKAFGSGGAAVTGVEAISNGVPAFRPPAWKNARQTLVIMGSSLGVMFLGLSILAARVRAMPYDSGDPTVISQVGKGVYGVSSMGHVLFYMLQVGTMLILVLAANTSFADFPRLASFHAGDNFMPRQFMVRGHRLVFSNGILFLAGAAIVTLLGTGGKVSRLIPLYAIGVFTSFTLSQAGMTRHHIREKEDGWRLGVFVNGMGALLSLLVLAIVARVKFAEGAWVIVLLVPIMVLGLVRLNKAYEAEEHELLDDVHELASAPVMRRHAVVVLVDNLDAAAARALQYARTLAADDLRAVHFDIDSWKTGVLTESWQRLGLARFPLDVIECPDRRMTRATLDLVAETTADGETEVSVLIPRREYTKVWHRLLHDRSSARISAALAALPHCNVTVVPYHLGATPDVLPELGLTGEPVVEPATNGHRKAEHRPAAPAAEMPGLPADRTPMADLLPRSRARVAGRVQLVRVQPWGSSPSLECRITDNSGVVTAVFLGRREVGGLRVGSVVVLEGAVNESRGRLVIMNPTFDIISVPPEPQAPGKH